MFYVNFVNSIFLPNFWIILELIEHNQRHVGKSSELVSGPSILGQ